MDARVKFTTGPAFGRTRLPAHDNLTAANLVGNPEPKFHPRRFSPAHIRQAAQRGIQMSILWLIIIGFVAGIIAKFLHPGSNEPAGFILTTALGIAGAFVATYLGQALGWYRADEGAGLIGAVVGAVIVLVVWSFFARRSAAT